MWRVPVAVAGAVVLSVLAPTAARTSTTKSAGPLRMIVVPAQVRPGQAVSVRVTGAQRAVGVGVGATVCASAPGAAKRCRQASLKPAAVTRRLRLTLPRAGRWTIVLHSASGPRLTRHVAVRRDARLRLLVAGDSLTFGLFQTLAGDLGSRATVRGDPHPGTGITKPFLDWPEHARQSVRSDRPDVTVVLLGSSDDAFPLIAASGQTVPCCGPDWITAYSLRVSGMMSTYLRDGSALVYWLKLPAPRSAVRVPIFQAENEAIARAAAGFDAGVRLITGVADVLSPGGRFHRSIVFRGRRRVVRDDDGVHLAAAGIRIASDIIRADLRSDDLVR
jgi:hypothetical protein